MIEAAGATLAGIVGLIFGSFANVCIHRIPEGASVVAPRSRCPRCGAGIAWYDNIPVLSWIALRARCRGCREPIPWIYPVVEILTAAGFAASYLRFGPGLDAAAAAWLVFNAIVLTAIDVRWFLLPDRLTLTGLGAALLFAAARGLAGGEDGTFLGGFFDEPVRLLAAAAGAALGASIPLAARAGWSILSRLRDGKGGEEEDGRGGPAASPGGGSAAPGGAMSLEEEVREEASREGMGLGDVKFLAMAGAFLGPRLVLITILLGSLGGCLLAIPWLLATRRDFRTPIPFGPFLAAGAVAALFAGERIAAWWAGWVGGLLG